VLEALLRQFKELPPYREAETAEDQREREALGQRIVDALVGTITGEHRKLWARTKATIDRHVEKLDFGAAARGFMAFPHALPEVAEAKAKFPEVIATQAELAVAHALKTRIWAEPIAKLERALKDTDLIRLTGPEHQATLEKSVKKLKVALDQLLYADFREAVGLANKLEKAKQYQLQAPLKTMQADLGRWIDWNVSMSKPTELEFEVEVDWEEWNNRNDVRVRVHANDKEIINETKPSQRGGKTGPIKSGKVVLVPRDTCSLRVELLTEDLVILGAKHRAEKEVKDEYTAETWFGKSFVVNDNLKTRLWVAVRGLPEQPVLKGQ
jgi:hypothetical protein